MGWLRSLLAALFLWAADPSAAQDASLSARLEAAATRGSTEAAYHLGMLYHLGLEGVARDPRRAFAYFRRAADGGDALGAYKVGCFYAGQGEGVVEPDEALALRYKLRAAEAGYVLAQTDVARIYHDREDADHAVQWLEAAARQGDAGAMMGALFYRSRNGPRPDAARAWLYFELTLRYLARVASEIDPGAPSLSRQELAAPLREMIGELDESGRAGGAQLLEAWHEERSPVTQRADLGLEAARRLVS